jgi:N-acetylneuraminate lyase
MNERLDKYKGIIPAVLTCFDDNEAVSAQKLEKYVDYLIRSGFKALYLTGSTGEFYYQTVEDRKLVYQTVMEVAKGRVPVIAHVAAATTKMSIELAEYAANVGVDALSAVPPLYYIQSEDAIGDYWDTIANATDCDFIIYNIPGATRYALSEDLYRRMLKNKKVIGVKNTTPAAEDLIRLKAIGGEDVVIFNGPDEQLLSGLCVGADGAIGGNYSMFPELVLKVKELYDRNEIQTARDLQYDIDRIIWKIREGKGDWISMVKAVVCARGNDVGNSRLPMKQCEESDKAIINETVQMIEKSICKYC